MERAWTRPNGDANGPRSNRSRRDIKSGMSGTNRCATRSRWPDWPSSSAAGSKPMCSWRLRALSTRNVVSFATISQRVKQHLRPAAADDRTLAALLADELDEARDLENRSVSSTEVERDSLCSELVFVDYSNRLEIRFERVLRIENHVAMAEAESMSSDVRRGFGLRPDARAGAGSEPGGLRRVIGHAAGRHGRHGPDHTVRRQPERVHALTNGRRRERSFVLVAKLIDDRSRAELVPAVLNEQRDVDAQDALWRKHRAPRRAERCSRETLGSGMNRAMDTGRDSVMPPNFGYPFYQPPSLLGPSSAFMGMSSM